MKPVAPSSPTCTSSPPSRTSSTVTVTTSFFFSAAAARSARAAGRRSALLELLHAEADALLLDVDVEHDGLDLFALAVQRQRVLARDAPGDVRHVDHAVDVAVAGR